MERLGVLTKLIWDGDFFFFAKQKKGGNNIWPFFYNKIKDRVVNKKIGGVFFISDEKTSNKIKNAHVLAEKKKIKQTVWWWWGH